MCPPPHSVARNTRRCLLCRGNSPGGERCACPICVSRQSCSWCSRDVAVSFLLFLRNSDFTCFAAARTVRAPVLVCNCLRCRPPSTLFFHHHCKSTCCDYAFPPFADAADRCSPLHLLQEKPTILCLICCRTHIGWSASLAGRSPLLYRCRMNFLSAVQTL